MSKEWVLNIIISLTASFLVWIHHIKWAVRFHGKHSETEVGFQKVYWGVTSGFTQVRERTGRGGLGRERIWYSCSSSLADPRGCCGAQRPFRGVLNMEVRNQVFVSSHRSVIGSELPFAQTSFLAKGISWEGLLCEPQQGHSLKLWAWVLASWKRNLGSDFSKFMRPY